MTGRTVNIKATEKQRIGWSVWEDDITDDLIYGGYAGGGKTMLAGLVLTGTAQKYPGSKQFLGRKELKRLMQTSYITLTQKVFPLYDLQAERDWHFDGKYNVVHFKNGSSIDLLDLDYQPSDPLFDRFGSTEYTRGWIEEASEVRFRAYDVLKTRVGRWMNVEFGIKGKIGLSLVPTDDWPYRLFYAPWKEAGRPIDPKHPLISVKAILNGKEVVRTFVFVPAAPGDNPFTAGEYAKTLATISDPVLRQRLAFGDWEYSAAADTLFLAQTIVDIFTSPVIASNDQFLTVDAARFGGDEIVLNYWRGWDSHRIDRFTNSPINTTADLVRTAADRYGIPREHILIDEDGVGGGVLDLVPGAIGFHGGAAPFGKVGEKPVRENYDNLRAQCVYHLAQIARERKLRVSDQNEDTRQRIAEDLKQFKRRDAGMDGRLKITKKEDIKDALGRSPDVGDTLMMRSYFDLRVREDDLSTRNQEITIHIPDL